MNNDSNLLIIGIIILIVILSGGFSMMGFGGFGYGMMSGLYGGLGFMWFFGWIIMILIITEERDFVSQIARPCRVL